MRGLGRGVKEAQGRDPGRRVGDDAGQACGQVGALEIGGMGHRSCGIALCFGAGYMALRADSIRARAVLEDTSAVALDEHPFSQVDQPALDRNGWPRRLIVVGVV